MKKSFTLEIPKTIDNIPLKNYQKYLQVLEENKENPDQEFLSLKLLNIFCNISVKEAYQLPLAQYESILKHLTELINTKSELKLRFKMTDPKGNKLEFGFIPNLDKMSLGEYIDAERYMGDWKDMHKAMAVLYRPIVAGNKDFYKIEKYEGTDKYADIMKDAPASVAIGSILFFLSLGIELSKTTLDSLLSQQQTSKEGLTAKDLEKNGDGINQYTRLQEEMYLKLTKLQELIYTKR
jgi:hypothetical protein|tara:strand:+ start:184 stop:894 length:711 start_codon:yes stop_codon:yes gene_type:complete